MEQLIINIKNKQKLSFVLQLFKQFDFIEVVKINEKKTISEYNFFASSGLWKDRQIDSKDIRNRAWKR